MKNNLDFKKDFPIFVNNPDLVYLDSASTSQKPQSVIAAVSDFYKNTNSNIHRGIYDLSQMATEIFENTRKKVADFAGAKSASEIIFTSGTTESINLVASGYARKFLKKGDCVILSEMEHHSNIVAWLRLKEEIGIKIKYIPVTDDGVLDYHNLELDYSEVKFVSLAHISNVLGTINPVKDIIKYFKKLNPDVKVLIDAAQSVPHLPIDVIDLDCDFLVFSSHKMLGPSGVGVLWGRQDLLEKMNPVIVGSHMIKKVGRDAYTVSDAPDKFEAGTRNLEGVVGLGAAIDYIENIGFERIQNHEERLTRYALDMFAELKHVKLFGARNPKNRIGVFSFAVGRVHSHDAAEILNRSGVAIRSGHHCAEVLMECLGVAGTARASLYIYNTKEDIDKLSEGIAEVERIFRVKK